MKYQLLTTVLFLTIISGCEPECKDKEPSIEGCQYTKYKHLFWTSSIGVVKDYIAFQPGSWWVYQNDKTLEYDTIEVIETEIYYKEIIGSSASRELKITLNQEQFYTTMSTSIGVYDNKFISYALRPSTPLGIVQEGFDTTYVDIIKNSSIFNSCIYQPFNYWFKPAGYLRDYTVNSTIFKDIFWFETDYFGSIPNWDRQNYLAHPSGPVTHHWAKDIGLIELKVSCGLRDPMTWKLVNYNVKKF